MKFQDIECNITIWKEGDAFVAHTPELDVSSCGETMEKARQNIEEALELYFAEAKRMGTLMQILEEAGFSTDAEKHWRAPEMIMHERRRLAFS